MGPEFWLTGYKYGNLINATELEIIVGLDFSFISEPVMARPSWA